MNQERVLLDGLFISLSHLMSSAADVRYTALLEKDEYEVFAPDQGDNLADGTSDAARIAVLNRLTKVFKTLPNEPVLISGMLCASGDLCKKIAAFNASKKVFLNSASKFQRNASVSFRENSARYISDVLKSEIGSYADKGLFDLNTLEHLACNVLDFNYCRAATRILPKHLDSFSWSWARNNRAILKVSRSQALELASRLKGEDGAKAYAAIEACPDKAFVKVRSSAEQLRASYQYYENGRLLTISTSVSGVVVAQQKHLPLPNLIWRDPPSQKEDKEVRKKHPTKIETSPFIKQLSLYRYKSPDYG